MHARPKSLQCGIHVSRSMSYTEACNLLTVKTSIDGEMFQGDRGGLGSAFSHQWKSCRRFFRILKLQSHTFRQAAWIPEVQENGQLQAGLAECPHTRISLGELLSLVLPSRPWKSLIELSRRQKGMAQKHRDRCFDSWFLWTCSLQLTHEHLRCIKSNWFRRHLPCRQWFLDLEAHLPVLFVRCWMRYPKTGMVARLANFPFHLARFLTFWVSKVQENIQDLVNGLGWMCRMTGRHVS